jgi:hypothetical protein
MLSDSPSLERIIAQAIQLQSDYPLADLRSDAELIPMTRERESPFAQDYPGENLGHDKIQDDLEEIMGLNQTKVTPKLKPRFGFWASRRVQNALTLAATTIALGLSISAILLYKDTVTEVISAPELIYSFDL